MAKAKKAAVQGEVIAKDAKPIAKDSKGDGVTAKVLLQSVKQYTSRPDLFLKTLERHDPGFIKRMNREISQRTKDYHTSRSRFVTWQSYASLALSFSVGLGLIGVIIYLLVVTRGNFPFWTILGVTVLYAVVQSGMPDAETITRAVGRMVAGLRRKPPKKP